MDTIGVICEPSHPVFWPVAERLSARGFGVRFLPPDDPLVRDDIGPLAALVNCARTPTSLAALSYADRTGVPTWNGFLPTTALSCRLVALDALEAVGCRVPDVRFERPDSGYRPRNRFGWDGRVALADCAEFYQEDVRTTPVDHRYYAVDDGRETHVRALAVRTELPDAGPLIERIDVDVTLAARVRELLDRFGARAVAVDFVEGADAFYAVDADPTPGFNGTGMDRRVADSVASLTTLGV